VTSARSGFARIIQTDGYTGWADTRHLTRITNAQARQYRTHLNARINDTTVPTYATDSLSLIHPFLLNYGTRLRVTSRRQGLAMVTLPDGRLIRLRSNRIRPINSRKDKRVSGTALVREARRFLGVPYLWGGITPLGFDCSGFVRAIYGRYQIALPRDTKDQIRTGHEITREKIKTGDLLFFDRHVGIAIGQDRLIHASRGNNGVAVNSLTPGRDDYAGDLDRDFKAARRVL
jgi:gamma-D-glutamyl-L-lysine dipeptidyl-peptidase